MKIKLLLASIALVCSQPVMSKAVVFTLASKHIATTVEHNEFNWGIGYSHKLSAYRSLVVGGYRNSRLRTDYSLYTLIDTVVVPNKLDLGYTVGASFYGSTENHRKHLRPAIGGFTTLHLDAKHALRLRGFYRLITLEYELNLEQ